MRKYLAAAALSLFVVAPADAATFPTLDGSDPLIWAHRGASLFSRENTLEAFELAQAENADGTELDLVLTADGELAVFHDTTLDVRTNVEDVFPDSRRRADGRYHVADFTMAELRTLEVDFPRDEIIRNPAINPNAVGPTQVFRIPSYADALDTVAAVPGFEVLTEVKIASDDPAERAAIVDALVTEWQSRGYVDETSPVRVQSFSEPFMREIAARLDAEGMTLQTYQLNPPTLDLSVLDQAGLVEALRTDYGFVDGVAINLNVFPIDGADFFDLFNPNGLDVAAAAHAAGLEILVWTLGPQPDLDLNQYIAWQFDRSLPIDWPGQYQQLYALGVDGIITDTPEIGVATRQVFAAVSEPAVVWLLLPAMAGLAIVVRRRRTVSGADGQSG